MSRQCARRVQSALLLFVYTVHVAGGCGPVTGVRPPPLSPPGGSEPDREEPLPVPTDSVLATEVGAEGSAAWLLAGALQDRRAVPGRAAAGAAGGCARGGGGAVPH
jgi:hypothetical protein